MGSYWSYVVLYGLICELHGVIWGCQGGGYVGVIQGYTGVI